VAVDVREPDLSNADALQAAFDAKTRAELADADALIGAGESGHSGVVIGPRIAFVVARPASAVAGEGRGVLTARVADAAAKAAEALGAAGDTFEIASRPVHGAPAEARARRLRLALEAVDPLVVIALDGEAASDLADAFGLDGLRRQSPVRVCGRAIGFAGEFAASLDDTTEKARAWSAMKAAAALAGLETKGRPNASQSTPQKVGD
jgi:hypothetical protein